MWLCIDIHVAVDKLVNSGPQNNQVHKQVKMIQSDSLHRAAQTQVSAFIP